MKPDELMATMENAKVMLQSQLKMNATTVGMVCPENPFQPPPLIHHLDLIQNMLGIGATKGNSLMVVMGMLFQRQEVMEMKPADWSMCR